MYNGLACSDKLNEECGIVGIYSNDIKDISKLTYFGLYSLQHRGQESCGIAVNNKGKIKYCKGMGLVSEVFDDDVLKNLDGNISIGHVRYSTTGESRASNAQPLVVKYKNGDIALAHNGNLVNAHTIREILEEEGVVLQTTIDTEVIVNLIARYHKSGIESAIKKVMELIRGSYALVLTMGDMLIGVRDPYGIRPLCIGKLKKGFVIASESCALDTVGADFIRDVEPGEIIIIDEKGMKSIPYDKWCKKSLCIFELIYFARPDSIMDGISVYLARKEAGRILARESKVDADIVISVPDSGTAAAIGFSEESGIPFSEGLIKNRYVGRTFIKPSQELREQGVRLKLNVLKENIKGKRVVLVDDSIVRGTTIRRIVDILKSAGAKEVHVRISSPPVKYPCFFGIDTPERKQLIGAKNTTEEIRKLINADSLSYLSIEGLIKTTGKNGGFCLACFNGDYPMEVPLG
ncbi:amidophosphoribosyltransferase [Caloranaerobacter sp. DY30410]|uniref:amidophosphoribosyltransferase n=1 Tax=Caloranaerobacter sp. DY30410 TaxID=3238305 RepID=UPI003D02DB41